MGFNTQPKGIPDGLLAVLPKDNKPWYTKGHLILLNYSILSLVLFSSANGYDGSLMNGLQSLDYWQTFMEKPRGEWLGFVGAIYWIGNGVCYPIAALIANRYGRKTAIYIGYVFLTLGAAITAGGKDRYFALMRLFVGCTSAFFGAPAIMLITEVAYPTHRSIASALFNCGWYIGGTIGAFIVFGTRNLQSDWSWRIPTVLQVLIPIVALPGLILCPESPRYLVSMDRSDAARQVLERTRDGRNNPALVQYELFEITEAIRIEKEAQGSASYVEMIKTKGNRHRVCISITLGIFSQVVGQNIISYYLPLVLNGVGVTSTTYQTIINACLNIWNFIFAAIAASCVDLVGRRALFLTSAAIMLFGYIMATALSATFERSSNNSIGFAVIPFFFIFFAGYDIALTPLVTSYTCEIWPYRLRSRGMTVSGVSVVISIVLNTFINPIALENIGWKYYLVFIAIIVAYGLCAWFFYPETRGHTLEQIVVIFDGEDSAVKDFVVSGSESTMKKSAVVTTEELW